MLLLTFVYEYLRTVFNSLVYISRSGIAGSCGISMFHCLRHCLAVFPFIFDVLGRTHELIMQRRTLMVTVDLYVQ